MRSADSTEFFSCRFQMTYTVRYVSAGSGRRTDSTPAGSVRGCSTETVSWVSLMFTHPTHPPSNEPALKQAGVVRLVSVTVYSILIHCFCLEFPLLLYTCIPFQNRAFYSYAKDWSLTIILLHTHVRNIVLYNLRRMLLYHVLTVCNKCSFYIQYITLHYLQNEK